LPCKADAPIIEHTIVDDGWVEVPLDFIFPFWGNSYTTSFMFANGVVGFISPNNIPGTGIVNDGLCCSGIDFENATYSSMSSQGYGGVRFDFTIMPWHTDLIDTGPGHFYTQGDSTYQKYMWEAVDEYYQTSRENTFDLTIYPLGNIHMTYQELDIANHSVTVAVVGDLSEGEYIQWFYNHPTSGAIYWDTSESAPVDIGEGASICDVVPLSSLVCDYYPAAYAEAYYAEQCNANSLYDTGCAGYWEAYSNQQCSLDSLWSTACPNYETAYLDDQCETDPLYSVYCPGYAAAIAEEEIEQELEEEFEEEWEEFLTYEVETIIPWDDFEFDTSFDDMPVFDDYEIIDDFTLEPEMDFEMTFEEVFQELEMEFMEEFEDFEMPSMEDFEMPSMEDFEEFEEPVMEPMEDMMEEFEDMPMEETMEEPEMEEPIDEPEPEEETISEEQEQEEPEQEEVIEEEPEEETERESDSEESEDDEISGEDTEEEVEEEVEEPEPEEESEDDDRVMMAEVETKKPTKKEMQAAKEKKMKEIIVNKLKSLAKEVGEASTLQAQKDLQNYIIALLGYNTGFNAYGSELVDGSFYKYEEIYQNVRLPENQRGLLNGLASEILHEKMVDMQWQK
tara:strand:+ start:266 stop:2125 length:1860 start_codon:yes stop_codon:yes gene_type:complete